MKKILSNIIIGTGFIAKNFDNYKKELKKLNVCLYAAGVSNSQINDEDLLIKERKKLLDFSRQFNQKKKLVYISTCGVLDASRKNNPYNKNKLQIENMIQKKFNKFLITRFPEVVGKNDNKTTLTNFLYHKIKNKKKFYVWKQAKRNIMDIQDIVLITMSFLSDKNLNNRKINIANPINNSVIEIVKNFEKLSDVKANYTLIDKGHNGCLIDISEISKIIKKKKIHFNKNYLYKVLKKYYF